METSIRLGGSLDEYVEATGEPIPLVVVSAIGYLSRYSLRNQGLFRVSGSQSEINRFKEAYERGEWVFLSFWCLNLQSLPSLACFPLLYCAKFMLFAKKF